MTLDTLHVVTLDRPVTDYPDPAAQAWSDWFRVAGIDPELVPVPSIMVVDDERQTVTHSAMRRTDDGHVVIGSTHPVVLDLHRDPPELPSIGYLVVHRASGIDVRDDADRAADRAAAGAGESFGRETGGESSPPDPPPGPPIPVEPAESNEHSNDRP